MLKLVFRYLIYKIFAGHRYGHGIHSPFAYSFIRNVLVDKVKDEKLDKVINWHRKIKNTRLPGNIKGYGAGSLYKRTLSAGKRIPASKIGVSPKYGKMLYKLVREYTPKLIIELGTGSGVSTAYLASGNENTEVITVEGSPERVAFAREMLSETGTGNIKFISAEFNVFLEDFTPGKKPFLAFIDGDHSFEPVMHYFNCFAEMADEDSIIVFDDIRWSAEMEKAWKTIADDSRVTVSIDLFFMGIVFFKTTVTPQKLIVNF